MGFLHTPGDKTQFEANADRARERATEILATNLADQAERERRVELGTDGRGLFSALIDRIRAVVGAIRRG